MANNEETTPVIILTQSYRIEGRIALLPGARLTDYVRQATDFIAVTDATVIDRHGVKLFTTKFIDVGRAYIELILPTDLVTKAV